MSETETNKINTLGDEKFEERAVALATNFPGSTPEKVKELKDTIYYNMASFKEAIKKINQGFNC